MSTLLAERLKSAGVDTDAARLHEMAVRMLRRSGGDPARAADLSADIVRADAGLLLALFGAAQVVTRLRDYLAQVAADMAGPAPGHETQGKGHHRCSDKANAGLPSPLRPVGGRSGQQHLAAQVAVDVIPDQPPPPSIRPGHMMLAAPAAKPAVPATDRPHIGHGHNSRGLASIAAVQAPMARSLLDTYLIDGDPIGDLPLGLVRRLARQKGVESRVLGAIAAHVSAPDIVAVRDVITAEKLRAFIANAEADHGG